LSLHRVIWPDIPGVGVSVTITGDEAVHAARAKRLEAGDRLALHDTRGKVAVADVTATRKSSRGMWEVEVVVRESVVVAQGVPRVEVWSATPKGARLDEMIEGLSEVGATSWSPLAAARSVVEPREGKLERLRRVTTESLKQCGRAWALEIGTGGGVKEAMAVPSAGSLVVAEATGESYTPRARMGGEGCKSEDEGAVVRVLVGPEGGFTSQELAVLREAGARFCEFGPHVMRIETAAVVAAAIVRDRERA
jgi:16S rRNA (uracil1498-N3)-methyltransferase